jgi:hypothetical protein
MPTGDHGLTTPEDPAPKTASAQGMHPYDGRDPGLLLGAMQRTAVSAMGKVLDSILRQADDYLFDHSQGGDGAELTALRDLRRARAQVSQRFELAMVNGFRQLTGAQPSGSGDLVLSLLADDALEEQLVNEQISESLTRLHAPALELIEKRLAVLLQRTEVAADENPVGPMHLAEDMRYALHAVELSTSVRIVLYKFLERELGSALGPLYAQLNASMAGAGILPQLKPTKRIEAPPQPAQSLGGNPADPAANASTYPVSGPADQVLFSNLIGMLQSWRQNLGGSLPGHALEGGQSLRVGEMMSVLSMMQPDPPPGLQQALGDSHISLAEQLRREVLAGARRLGLGGDDLGLSNTEEEAVDLVGMLFDVLLDERHFEPDVRSKIGRMLVPYVKVAVQDRRMFLYKGHPARRLLNAVAEACEGNNGEGANERELLDRVDSTIDRLVAEFNEDIAIFEVLETELRAFMEQQRKRIELAERRAAETQRGRERLEQAREEAAADVDRRRGLRMMPPALDEFAVRYTGHHLTQLILREGRDSPHYGKSLHALEGLLVAFDHAELGTPAERLPALQREPILAIFASSGIAGHAAEEAIATLQSTLAQLAAGEEIAANEAHLPEQAIQPVAPPPIEPVLALATSKDNLDFDAAMADRMRALPIGTWLQLTSESGRVEPAKVSWISPISSRLLFVNRRGIRVLVASAEELAAMAKLGTVQLREADNAFEDAMHQMVGRLKTATQPS